MARARNHPRALPEKCHWRVERLDSFSESANTGDVNLRIAATATTFSPDAREAARLSRECGFAGLLFDAYANSLSIPELTQTGRREFRHVLGAQEIELIGLQGDLGAKGLGPGADLDRVLDRIDR